MKKETILLACFCMVLSFASAQSTDLQVISASGEHYSSPQGQVTMTVGEAVVSHFQSATNHITSGFHQPMLEVELIDAIAATLALAIEVFPNPTTAYLNLEIPSSKGDKDEMTGQVYNKSGQIVRDFKVQPLTIQHQVNFSDLPEGVYVMRLKRGKSTNSYKIIKN